MDYFFNDKDILLETVEAGKTTRKIRAYSEEIMMVEVYFEDNAIGYEHTHVHEQTTYCLEGSFEFKIGDQTGVISVGDSIYMPSNILHGCRLLSEKGRVLDVFTPCRKDFL